MVYIAADLKINQNEDLISENWNEVIEDNDRVLLMGIVTETDKDFTKNFLSKLKGKKTLIDFKENKGFLKQDYLDMGIERVINIGGFVKDKNGNKILILTTEKDYRDITRKYYCAAARSLPISKSLFGKKVLNLSVENWGYFPVEYNQIPFMIESMKENLK